MYACKLLPPYRTLNFIHFGGVYVELFLIIVKEQGKNHIGVTYSHIERLCVCVCNIRQSL